MDIDIGIDMDMGMGMDMDMDMDKRGMQCGGIIERGLYNDRSGSSRETKL